MKAQHDIVSPLKNEEKKYIIIDISKQYSRVLV